MDWAIWREYELLLSAMSSWLLWAWKSGLVGGRKS
jgi:hypothetical protein